MSPGIWLLQNSPRFAFILVGIAFVFVVIPGVRRLTEGHAYSVAWSGTWGEVPLFIIWTLGLAIVRNEPVPAILLNQWVNVGIFAVFQAIGLFLWLKPDGHNNFTDGFHNIAVVPVFGYITTLCMLLFLLTSHFLFLAFGFIAIGVWGFFVVKDGKEGNMQQASHVEKTGVPWIFGTKWIVQFINALGLAIFFFILAEVLGPRLAFAFF